MVRFSGTLPKVTLTKVISFHWDEGIHGEKIHEDKICEIGFLHQKRGESVLAEIDSREPG